MSKKTIELEVIQCDFKDENGHLCTKEGPRESMRTCRVCGIDVCENHSDLTTVTSRVIDLLVAGQTRDVYYFCFEHMDDLVKLVIEKFGDDYEVPPSHYGGFPGATGTLNAKPIFFNKPSNVKMPI